MPNSCRRNDSEIVNPEQWSLLLTARMVNYTTGLLFPLCVREYKMWKRSQMKVINCNMLFLLRALFSVKNKIKFLPNGLYI